MQRFSLWAVALVCFFSAGIGLAQELPTDNPREVWIDGRQVRHSWKNDRILIDNLRAETLLRVKRQVDLIEALEERGGYVWTVTDGRFEAVRDSTKHSVIDDASRANGLKGAMPPDNMWYLTYLPMLSALLALATGTLVWISPTHTSGKLNTVGQTAVVMAAISAFLTVGVHVKSNREESYKIQSLADILEKNTETLDRVELLSLQIEDGNSSIAEGVAEQVLANNAGERIQKNRADSILGRLEQTKLGARNKERDYLSQIDGLEAEKKALKKENDALKKDNEHLRRELSQGDNFVKVPSVDSAILGEPTAWP